MPRAGWSGIEESIKRLATVPGGQGIRQKAAQIFMAPKWLWAVPLLARSRVLDLWAYPNGTHNDPENTFSTPMPFVVF